MKLKAKGIDGIFLGESTDREEKGVEDLQTFRGQAEEDELSAKETKIE